MKSPFGLLLPLVVSAALHAAAMGWTVWGARPGDAAPPEPEPATDVWRGTTVEVTTAEATTAEGQDESSEGFGERIELADEPDRPVAADPPRPVVAKVSLVSSKPVVKPVPRTKPTPPVAKQAAAESLPSDVSGHAAAAKVETTRAGAPGATNAGRSADLASAMRASTVGGGSAGGTYGAVGVDLRERNLFRALVRALPVAVRGDQAWWQWSMGALGQARFRLTLDEAGRITDTEWLPPKRSNRAFALVSRMSALLRAGRFALPAGNERGGTQVFELALRMGAGEPSVQSTSSPGDVVEMGFDAPAGSREGRAWIREATGRRLEGTIRRVAEQPASSVTDGSSSARSSFRTDDSPLAAAP